ncbi:MAG: response regulator [Deltaproteobacteria bacterium]|nr:response regulator [Deltaproteobacteria bacterium]
MPDKTARILIVDDARSVRNMTNDCLKDMGYVHVDEAVNGEMALAMVRVNKYHLVISDWNMPVKTGLELLSEIRADKAIKFTPFLMVTAEASKENIIKAVKAGATSYIVKPFTADTLKTKIKSLIP